MDQKYSSRLLNQDDWKRTQVRIPQNQYLKISEYAEQKKLSLNSAMLELIQQGINLQENQKKINQLDDIPVEELLAVVMKKLGKSEIKLELDDLKK